MVALPALVLLLFGGGRWFRREAGGAASPRSYDPIVGRRTALDTWASTRARDAPAAPGHARRWWVFCWDGASWNVIVPMMRQGRLPHLARMIARGSAGNLYTIRPTFSPVVWTTIATGADPDHHGILDFVRRPSGTALKRMTAGQRAGLHFYSNADRRVPAIWNRLSERRQPVMIVGYHNTYPAERVTGVMVSSYLVRRHSLEAYGVEPEPNTALAHPASVVRRLAAPERPLRRLTAAEMRRFAHFHDDEFAPLMTRLFQGDHRDPRSVRWSYLCRAYTNDRFHAELAYELLPSVRPDLLMLHFQSADWAAHEFLAFRQPGRRVDEARGHGGRRRYGGTVEAFYEYLDEWLGRFLARRDADTAVAVLSDHGFEADLDEEGRGHHAGAPPGILVLEGPGVRQGQRLDEATVYDVFPTLAAALGLPLVSRQRGRPLTEAFAAGALDATPARIQETARFQPDIALPNGLEGELETELRSLGYLQ